MDLRVAPVAAVRFGRTDREAEDLTEEYRDMSPERVAVPAERVAVERPWAERPLRERLIDELLLPAEVEKEPMPPLPADPVVDSLEV